MLHEKEYYFRNDTSDCKDPMFIYRHKIDLWKTYIKPRKAPAPPTIPRVPRSGGPGPLRSIKDNHATQHELLVVRDRDGHEKSYF